ncbi:MAG: hypothetical protein AB8I08_26575 [Sandaracinaceae bacterium]
MEDHSRLRLTRRNLLLGTASGLALLACDGDDDPDAGTRDAGRMVDAGGGPTDAGRDAGNPVDAGTPTDSGPTPDSGGSCADLSFDIGDPHPAGFRHNLVIELADVQAGVERTYQIQGESPHPHTLVVTAADFAVLAGGGSVTINSSEDMGFDLHDHPVTISCA